MRIVLHGKARADTSKIIDYYEEVGSRELADDFYRELMHFIAQAGERPESFGLRQGELRRVDLRRFPYHFLFRVRGDVVLILVVRHHRRHPSFGSRRR